MVKLIARSPAAGLLPIEMSGLTLTELEPEAITCVKPLNGGLPKLDGPWPEPGGSAKAKGRLTLWSGLDEVLVLGPPVSPKGALVVDQSDAWAVLALEGPDAQAVLARLTPLDLRDRALAVGGTARSMLGHMNCLFFRAAETRFELLVFRSMAGTAVHHLQDAMESVLAQRG